MPTAGQSSPFPFLVNRSKTGNLPVYLDYKSGRTKVVTIVRKIEGDVSVSYATVWLWGVSASWNAPGFSEMLLVLYY